MANKKIAFIITKLELGGAQKSVLYSVKNINRPPFKTYLLCGKGGFLDKTAKKTIKAIFFIPDMVREILQKYFYILAEKLLAGFTDRLVFVSREDMDNALRLKIAKASQCRLIRAGVEVKRRADFKDFDREAKLKELGLKPNARIILSTANLKPQKNPLDMIRAAAIVCRKEPRCVYLYTGTGPLKKAAAKLIARYKLKNNFKLLGHRKDIEQLLAVAEVFSLSSLWEGLPMALAEALFMDVPAVCYDSGGVKEILKDGQNGFLIKRGDYKALAQGHIKALKRKDFSFKEEDLEDFDIKNMINRQRELYLNLGGRR